jgi:hypothetical protein
MFSPPKWRFARNFQSLPGLAGEPAMNADCDGRSGPAAIRPAPSARKPANPAASHHQPATKFPPRAPADPYCRRFGLISALSRD